MEKITFKERKKLIYKDFTNVRTEEIKLECKFREKLYKYFEENEGKHFDDIMKIANKENKDLIKKIQKLNIKKIGLEIFYNSMCDEDIIADIIMKPTPTPNTIINY